MKVTIEKGQVHNVSIQGGFSGPYINLDLSPHVAYELLCALEAKREEIKDLATNYYECNECGETHHTSLVCPNRERESHE